MKPDSYTLVEEEKLMRTVCLAAFIFILLGISAKAENRDGLGDQAEEATLLAGRLQWTTAKPVVQALSSGGEDWIAVKDPSVVRFNGTP